MPGWGLTIRHTAGTSNYRVTGCRAIEQAHGHPPAIRLTLRDIGATRLDVPGNGLATLTTKHGKMVPALAKRWTVSQPGGGYVMSFLTKAQEEGLAIILEPGKEADLVFLFPEVEAGDKVRFGVLKTEVKYDAGRVEQWNEPIGPFGC